VEEELIDAEAHGAVLTDAASQCFPHGVPRLSFAPYPIRFAYVPGAILMLHEVNHNLRLIHMDRKEAPPDTPNRPKGDFMTVVFRADFGKRGVGTESLTLEREPDGKWRVIGYLMK